MNKNLIMFKGGQGIIEVYDTLFSFTKYIGCIYFQNYLNRGVFIGWRSSYDVINSPTILRDIADIIDEFYKNKDMQDQIGVL